MREVVQTVLDHLSDQAVGKRISIQLHMGGMTGDGQAFIDQELLTKALNHLLENSLEAVGMNPPSQQTRPIKVALFDDGESVKIAISDRGQGIAKENLGLIFEPFFSTRPDRAGLGLTFVRRVVDEHSGKIRVESRLRKGTTITLELPKDRRRRIRREFLSPLALESGDRQALT